MAPPTDREGGRYDPPIPTYEQAIALPSPSNFDPLSPMGEAYYAPEHESRTLLRHGHQRTTSTGSRPNESVSTPRSRSHRPSGYRPPTVETDDEDSTWSSSDSEDGHGDVETGRAHTRRDMEQFDLDDPLSGDSPGRRGRPSIFGKPIGQLLPRWRWNWRWPMPRLPLRLADARLRLGGFSRLRASETDAAAAAAAAAAAETATGDGESPPEPTPRRFWPAWLTMTPATAFILFGRVLALTLVLAFVYLIFMSDMFTSMSRRLGNQSFDPEGVRLFIQTRVDPGNMQDISRHFTSYSHIAGTEGDYALAIDVKNLFHKYGLEDVAVDEYQVYLNFPTVDGRAVEIIGADGKATWSANLQEDKQDGEAYGHQTYAFHGLSKSGDVRGPLIYANYGSREDFQKLQDLGIDTHGAIALVKYYGPQGDRALKVKAAELAGFAGCLIYSDPQDDGFLRGPVAPDGPYMPADGIQRGSVGLSSWVVGDVLTPGWESTKGNPRLPPGPRCKGLVQIPSLPLAWRDAKVLLQHLQGAGVRVPAGWEGGVPDVGEWWTGSLTASPTVRLKNEQDEETDHTILNVYGRIAGLEQSAKSVIVGNHRDAWTTGASDPHSGTAVMMDVARIFGDLYQRGWRPLRTIEFMSWDAEEYNLIGSTEYVEANMDDVRANALAYINLDTAVAGPRLHAAGSPVFSKLLAQVLKRVSDPTANASLFDQWQAHQSVLEVLGAGSDYVAFQDLAGTSSLDLFFDGAPNAMPLHSAYESFDWMDRIGDPGFAYHGVLAEIVGLLLIELADRPVLPFDMAAYAGALRLWVRELTEWVRGRADAATPRVALDAVVNLDVLHAAAETVAASVAEFEKWEREWQTQVLGAGGWEPINVGHQREEYNTRMAMFETDLLDLAEGGGIPNRTQFRHVLYGPSLWNSYEGLLFPAVRDTVDAGDWSLVNATVARIAAIMERAAANLVI